MDIRDKYPPEYKCDDGHFVRSKAEMIIDNWLYKHNISHAYEIIVFLPNNPDSMMYCDFYLPTHDLYIEYSGLLGKGNDEYDYRRRDKMNLYSDNNLDVLEFDDDAIKRINDIFPKAIANKLY